MTTPDGGFGPAFNVQLATTTDTARAGVVGGVGVGVGVGHRGAGPGQATPML